MKLTLTPMQAAERLSDGQSGFSFAGAYALAEYLEKIDADMEFDEVAIRCQFSEYASALDAAADYGYVPDEEGSREEAREWLAQRTAVIPFEGGVVVQIW